MLMLSENRLEKNRGSMGYRQLTLALATILGLFIQWTALAVQNKIINELLMQINVILLIDIPVPVK